METSIQEQADVRIGVVNARLKYLAEAIPKPVNYTYDPPAGVPRRARTRRIPPAMRCANCPTAASRTAPRNASRSAKCR